MIQLTRNGLKNQRSISHGLSNGTNSVLVLIYRHNARSGSQSNGGFQAHNAIPISRVRDAPKGLHSSQPCTQNHPVDLTSPPIVTAAKPSDMATPQPDEDPAGS